MSQRTERIDELLRQEIGQALEREIADPAIGFVTVTDVETSPDLSHARVWFSVIGTSEERKATLAALRRAMPFVRRGLGSKLRLRRIPELDVRLDDSVERGTRVLHLLDELEAGRVPSDDAAAGESLPTPVPRIGRLGDAPAGDAPAGDAPAGDAPEPDAPESAAGEAAAPRPARSRRGFSARRDAGRKPGARARRTR